MKTLSFLFALALAVPAFAGTKHSPTSQFPSYEGRVMCGYQGWFHAEGDGSGRGWVHFSTKREKFTPETLHLDFWPDVSEYKQLYPTGFKFEDGKNAQIFSSWDADTTDVHFRWMQEYGIDGVFMQRFFGVTRTAKSRREGRVILGNALKASQKHGRAIAVMYDLSGLKASGENCDSIIQDWKEIVDELKMTSQATNTYLYHNGKPLVAIWGLGFPDRSYNIRNIGIAKVIDFLKHDPEYGGCAVMLGVPTYFRELKVDCTSDPYLHELITSADVVMPWMVGRFTPLLHDEIERYGAQVKADLAWCNEKHVSYAPCVYPGFSWYNLSKEEFGGKNPLNQIPRQKGQFLWNQVNAAIGSGAKMIYLAMFDEMDEGTAIFKCTNRLPAGCKLNDYEGLPSDHYLWLTGQAGKLLRGEIPASEQLPARVTEARK